jgi:FdrA protein
VTAFVIVRKDAYHDSVLLMRVSQALKNLDRIEDVVVAMGTPHNRELLRQNGYGGEALDAAGPNDLVIAVKGDPAGSEIVEATIEKLLKPSGTAPDAGSRPATLSGAIRAHPETNLVLISVPGEYAAAEARRALSLGRHVMIFSSNVDIEDEIRLKKEAVARGLLCMGPDCGTAIIGGKPLGFANAVRRGSIGVVGAAGTGIQEVTSCIHRLGGGISQAIGVGGRDLSDRVGGAMTLFGIEALTADPGTEVIVVISKPPSPAVGKDVLLALRRSSKRSVVHFVGAAGPGTSRPDRASANERLPNGAERILFADSLAGAAEAACRQVGIRFPEPERPIRAEDLHMRGGSRLAELAARLHPGTRLCALFCGGTLGHEALAILTRAGTEVRSNLHKTGPLLVSGTERADGHFLLDLGDEIFTQGRPHPMIEPVLRNERLVAESAHAGVGILLFDVVLGYGSHPDPAGILLDGIERARRIAAGRGESLIAIASVTGTPDDPQNSSSQVRKLEEAGVAVAPDNRAAAEMAAALLKRIG